MSIVKSFSVGHGDMFYIQHGSDNFTIIDCCLSLDDRQRIVAELEAKATGKKIRRFISTHPDDDHICGLVYLDIQMEILNFYVVQNAATKTDQTDDFDKYCGLRESATKAFYIYKGCSRKWMNIAADGRGSSGLSVLWPETGNQFYKEALEAAADGLSPNNISAIVRYNLQNGGSALWMGDLDTDFMTDIEGAVDLVQTDILFAPHHGRESGRIPTSMLETIAPKIIVIGEAPSEYLHYYDGYNTITQNSAGDITFDFVTGKVHVYVSERYYSVGFLSNENVQNQSLGYYLGTLKI
jgi:beta-lactamase superfamily II metal-dependent hydrolase